MPEGQTASSHGVTARGAESAGPRITPGENRAFILGKHTLCRFMPLLFEQAYYFEGCQTRRMPQHELFSASSVIPVERDKTVIIIITPLEIMFSDVRNSIQNFHSIIPIGAAVHGSRFPVANTFYDVPATLVCPENRINKIKEITDFFWH